VDTLKLTFPYKTYLAIKQRKEGKIMNLKNFIEKINSLNDWVGRVVCMLIVPMIFLLVLEVVMRYVFNQPTIWVHETSGMIYAVYFLLGGAYALRWDGNINVEILYAKLSLRKRAIIDLVTWLFFYLFCGTLFVRGIPYAWNATVNFQRSNTLFGPPIWPVKILIPVAAGLLLLQGMAKTIKSATIAVTGHEFPSKDE
jgi:TRAP-type mannitol/chloroaromatic compound transport system permease small subunit